MASLLADEQFQLAVVQDLRSRGHDIVTVQAEGLVATPDPAVLAAATALGRAVLTHDRDYIRLHKSGVAHAGIVFASDDRDLAALADRIHAALAATPQLAGQLIRVYRPNPPPVP
jgi:hypothetical protein